MHNKNRKLFKSNYATTSQELFNAVASYPPTASFERERPTARQGKNSNYPVGADAKNKAEPLLSSLVGFETNSLFEEGSALFSRQYSNSK